MIYLQLEEELQQGLRPLMSRHRLHVTCASAAQNGLCLTTAESRPKALSLWVYYLFIDCILWAL